MIVKLILHKKKDAFSIWNKEGDRLYYSDKPKDLEMCIHLLTVSKKPTDKEFAEATLRGFKLIQYVRQPTEEEITKATENKQELFYKPEIREFSYFNAKWVKGVVTMVKRASGYSW